jgi:chaperone modulatory protein CbpM
MKPEPTEVLWLDEHAELSLAELADFARLTEAELLELVACGVIAPLARAGPAPAFAAACVAAARTASRLREDFDLDAQGVALALVLLDRIRGLEARIRDLEAQLPRWFP